MKLIIPLAHKNNSKRPNPQKTDINLARDFSTPLQILNLKNKQVTNLALALCHWKEWIQDL